mgnify:CR=1 FL=1
MKKIILFTIFCTFLTSCVESVVFGTVAGGVVATREKSVKSTLMDTKIAAIIDAKLVSIGLLTPKNSVKVMVSEGRVLLTGTITEVEKGRKIYELAWNTKGVVEVVDEVKINQGKFKAKDFTSYFTDTYLVAKIKTKLFFNRDVTAADFKITSSYGEIYIIGVAKDQVEMSETLRVISNSGGVKKVINHTILNDDNRRRSQ